MSDTKCVYRKTKQGEWVVLGPADVVSAGHDVTVTRKNGATKTERVASISKPFEVDGVECVYGYLGKRNESDTPNVQAAPADGGIVAVPVALIRQLAALLD